MRLKNPILGLLLALGLFVSMWFYVQGILIPYQENDARTHNRPRGILSDLYPRWIGSRAVLLEHRDPYSDEVTREIQTGYYGRPIDPNRPGDPHDEQRFAYPVYVAFLLYPTLQIPFESVQALFRWGLFVVTAATVLLWLRFLDWRLPTWAVVALILVTCGSFQVIQGIKLQQLSLLVAFLISACAAVLVAGNLVLPGVLLALATIKPQLAVLPAFWLMLWAISGWRERRRLVLAFAATLALLVGAGEYILPGWIPRFLAGINAYERYTGGGSLLDLLAGRTVGALLTVACLLGLAAMLWRMRTMSAGSYEFRAAMAVVLVVTVVVVPMMAPYNQVLLLPAIFLVVQAWKELWRRGPVSRICLVIAAVLVLWPWVVSVALAAASFFLPGETEQRAWAVPLWSSVGIPVVILPLAVSMTMSKQSREPVP
jgi:hypothetical protein